MYEIVVATSLFMHAHIFSLHTLILLQYMHSSFFLVTTAVFFYSSGRRVLNDWTLIQTLTIRKLNKVSYKKKSLFFLSFFRFLRFQPIPSWIWPTCVFFFCFFCFVFRPVQSTFALPWGPEGKRRAGHRLNCDPLPQGVSGFISARLSGGESTGGSVKQSGWRGGRGVDEERNEELQRGWRSGWTLSRIKYWS